MKKVEIPVPKLENYIQQLASAAGLLDQLESAVRKFWGQKVNVYYQGECTSEYYAQIANATQVLLAGKWNIHVAGAELKNVAFIFYGGKVKMQCNFTRMLPELPYMNFRAFRMINPQMAFDLSKNQRIIDIHFKKVEARKEASYEA